MELPNYLYHYTSIDSFISIFKSSTIRLYNITQQSDPFELFETGNKFLRYLYNETLTEDFRNNKTEFNGLKLALMIFLHKYHSNDTELNYIISQSLIKSEQGVYKDLIKIFDRRELIYFISCFSYGFKNDYLWKNYADSYNGVVFKIPINIIDKKRFGINKVQYFDDILNDYLVNLIGNKYKKDGDIYEYVEIIISNVLKLKKIDFQKENEIRIIDHYDSANKNFQKYTDPKGRIYCELKPNKMLFKSSLKNIYFHENIDESNYKKLLKISKELKLNLTKVI